MSGKVRLSLDVSAEANDKLEELARQMGVTKSDVLRRALALVDVSAKATRQGKHVGIAIESASLETEFVGL